MKNNKGFIGIGIIIAIIIVLIVGVGMYYVDKNFNQKNLPVVINNSIDTKQLVSSNKLFDFFDTFMASEDMGTPDVKFMYPEQHLILLSYPTSQETGAYGVYDYKNNILYKGVGSSGQTLDQQPIAFIGSDKLLVYSVGEQGPDPIGNINGVLTVQDFYTKTVKTVMTDVSLSTIGVYPKYGKVIVIDTTNKGRFNLNTETLELSPSIR